MGVVKEWGQNDPAPRLISSNGALAIKAEINIELDITRIYNTGRKKKSTQDRGGGHFWIESKGSGMLKGPG